MNEATASLPRAAKEIKLTPAQEARFWSKVDKINCPTMPHMESPCWLWTAEISSKGTAFFICEANILKLTASHGHSHIIKFQTGFAFATIVINAHAAGQIIFF